MATDIIGSATSAGTPSALRDTARDLSKSFAETADSLTDNATLTRRVLMRKLIERGVSDDVAERDALTVKAAMLTAARAAMETAQELQALCDALDAYTEDLHAGPGAR